MFVNFFKDGTVLKIISDLGVYDNITNDMSFEENVKMYYLESTLFSEKADFINSKNYLLVQGNVAEGLEGGLKADKMSFDLTEKKLRISMYNEDKVNIGLTIRWKSFRIIKFKKNKPVLQVKGEQILVEGQY